MAVIGTIATNLIMQTAGFEQGAKKGIDISKQLGGGLEGLKGAAGAIGPAFASVLAPIGAAVGSFFAVKHVVSEVTDAMDRVSTAAKSAEALGLPIDKFVAYERGAKKAGVESEQFVTAMRKVEIAAADAADGQESAVKNFDKLGISAEKFKALKPDEQLAVLADKFQGVTNQADRAQLAQDMFGRGGIRMLNFLKDGADGLEHMRDKADALGITLTEGEVTDIRKAKGAIGELNSVFEGMWNHLAAELAPTIKDVASSITAWFEDNMPAIRTFIGWVGKLAAAAAEVGKAFAMAVGWVGKLMGFGALSDWMGGDKKPVARAAEKKANADKDNSYKTPEKVAKTLDELQKQLDTFGMTAAQKKVADLQKLGASKGDIDKATELQERFDLMEKDKKDREELTKQAKKVFDETRTPQEKFAAKVADLDRLLGVGAIDKTTRARGAAGFAKERDEELQKLYGKPAESPQALERGTGEAMTAFLRAQQGVYGDPVQQLMAEHHRQQMAKFDDVRTAIENNRQRMGAI